MKEIMRKKGRPAKLVPHKFKANRKRCFNFNCETSSYFLIFLNKELIYRVYKVPLFILKVSYFPINFYMPPRKSQRIHIQDDRSLFMSSPMTL